MGLFSKQVDPTTAPFDVNTIEDDIRDTLSHPRDSFLGSVDEITDETPLPMVEYAPRIPTGLTADGFVATTEDIGKITAEAVKANHEQAAKALETLGQEIVFQVSQIEQLKMTSQKMLEEIKEMVEAYRDQGKSHALQIEAKATDLADVRTKIDEMRRKIGS